MGRPDVVTRLEKRPRRLIIAVSFFGNGESAMESREITVAGVWAFAVIALIGGIYGKLDGFAILLFFIFAVVVSLGVVAMPTSQPKGQKDASGAGSST